MAAGLLFPMKGLVGLLGVPAADSAVAENYPLPSSGKPSVSDSFRDRRECSWVVHKVFHRVRTN